MPKTTPPPKGPDRTREALVRAALRLFGHKGFYATSTREIAAEAGANVAAIGYHFGGKDGLRLACGEAVAARIGEVLPADDTPAELTREAAVARLEAAVAGVARFLTLDPRADALVAFMLREITEAGPVLKLVYREMFEPRHRAICRLWGAATGTDPESEATRLAVFAMIGQVIYFRIGRPLILMRMDWSDIGPAEAGRIADLLKRNLRAALDASAGDAP